MEFTRIELLCRLAKLAYEAGKLEYSAKLYEQAMAEASQYDKIKLFRMAPPASNIGEIAARN